MSASEPVTDKTPPESTVAEPASLTAPMSTPIQGEGGAACADARAA